ncbi:hypothetical protein THAOC_16058 [Thalassiosira oceanica]|uniref:Uncharacterized protein n=1 Tax=Thalassiosira oceanica TaxID=159749 RepID=K0SB14_THAOC|nr:hypothetical protein THAOC_16058 [Thalassiosira oceanica]|eukprot:EJK63293.1 hypothetical protein THAOC_16058 [Thalassiosira oceanica]
MAEVGEDAGSEPTRNQDTGDSVPQITTLPPDKVDEGEGDEAKVNLLNNGPEVAAQSSGVVRQQLNEDGIGVPVNPDRENTPAMTSDQEEEVSTSEVTKVDLLNGDFSTTQSSDIDAQQLVNDEVNLSEGGSATLNTSDQDEKVVSTSVAAASAASEEDNVNAKVDEVATQLPCVEESENDKVGGMNTALAMSDPNEEAAASDDVLSNFDMPSDSVGAQTLEATQVKNNLPSSGYDLLGFGSLDETPAGNGTKSDLNGKVFNDEMGSETAEVDTNFGSSSSAEVVLQNNGAVESDDGESGEQNREEVEGAQGSEESNHADGMTSSSENPVLSPDASDHLDTSHQNNDGQVNSNNEPVEGRLGKPLVVEETGQSGLATNLAPPEAGDILRLEEEESQPSDCIVASGPGAEPETEPLTEEEEEWISMGETNAGKMQAEALLVEVQSRLEAEMSQRAESDEKCRSLLDKLTSFETTMAKYDSLEDQLEKSNANLVQVVTEKSKLEQEIERLREVRETSEQKEIILSNRLNEAKKKEANKSKSAGILEADNEQLRDELKKAKDELETTAKAKARLESNMEKLKMKAVDRVKQAESALAEERALNEERKKKMKTFVETRAEQLREAKDSVNDMSKELDETRASLRSSRDREDVYQKEADAAKLKYRELQRDMERMKRSSEQLQRMGANFEQELEKSANETEEHKKKRISAKHEIMQMVRTLDVEKTVSSKLRESVKFTFTPKALSQQELLTECLRDFETELERLANKTGKTLQPSPEVNEQTGGSNQGGEDSFQVNSAARRKKTSRAAKADMDTERLIANLEQETQQVSKGIMALSASIERLRGLLIDEHPFGCLNYFSNIVAAAAGAGEARHSILDSSEDQEEDRANSGRFV